MISAYDFGTRYPPKTRARPSRPAKIAMARLTRRLIGATGTRENVLAIGRTLGVQLALEALLAPGAATTTGPGESVDRLRLVEWYVEDRGRDRALAVAAIAVRRTSSRRAHQQASKTRTDGAISGRRSRPPAPPAAGRRRLRPYFWTITRATLRRLFTSAPFARSATASAVENTARRPLACFEAPTW